MTDLEPTVAIFSKDSFLSTSLKKKLISKNFKALNNPRTINSADYVVINLSSGLSLSEFSKFMSSVDKKCLVIIDSKEKEQIKKILNINNLLSVGYVKDFKDKLIDYSENITKELLSFGHTGKGFLLKGKEVKGSLVPDLIEPIDTKPKSKKINVPFKKLFLALIAFVSLLLIPAFSLLLSASTLYLGVRNISSNKKVSNRFLIISKSSADFVKYFNYNFKFYINLAETIDQSISVVKNAAEVLEISNSLVGSITGNKIYNVSEASLQLSAELDALYVNIGFLKGQVDSLNSFPLNKIRDKYISSKVDLMEFSKKIYAAKELASRLSILLGDNTPKKYLVLFQNNMELRPTGGFIGSFALLTLDGGRLSDITVSDVYSADGQLKGHVDPPIPIKDILGEGGWYMRDANWDPDFPTSASKIEWFLDKEINTQVDGVIAIDLHLVQNLLEVIGPITLSDFSKVITSENLYQTTQEEVENEFFPGSTKKSGFLTALSGQLITELENLEGNKKSQTLIKIYESIEEDHIQVFIHDTNIQNIFNRLGYDGAIDTSINCGIRCLWDKYGLVDANLGVNKANYYIKRTQDLYISLGKEKISHELLVTYTNSANQILGNAGRYKSYTRLIIPQEAVVANVRIYEIGGEYKDLEYKIEDLNGRREIGFLLEVMPSSSVRVQIAWNLPQKYLSNGGEYRLKISKQSGTDADLLGITIKQSELVPSVTIPSFTLTRQGVYLYNTNLRHDFEAKVFVK